jgi:CRISPR-associated protein Csm2
MISFYKETGSIDPKLFSDIAEKLARDINMSGGKKANRRTQLRRFYDEVQRLNEATRTRPDDWNNIVPYVNMLIAKAAYAEGRGLVTSDFVSFLKESISQIKESQDLDVFANFFEAFWGFYRQYE